MRDLRKALRDDSQQIIRTIARRGYLLFSCETAPEIPRDQPAVAVLRFANQGDLADEPFVDGFTEDLVSGLARFRTVTVLARNSTFAFGSDGVSDWRGIGGKLGANSLIHGRVRLAANAIEARVGLIDTAKGAALWGESFSAEKADILDIQDEIAKKIINRLVTRLEDASLTGTAAKQITSLAAYELLLRGLVPLRGYREEDNLAAKALFEQAAARDPDYALAHSYMALADLAIGGYGEASPEIIADAVERASRAVTLAPEEPVAIALSRWHA